MNRLSQVLGLTGMVFGPLGMVAGVKAGEVAERVTLCARDAVIGSPYIASVGLRALRQGRSFQAVWTEEFRDPETQRILDSFEREMGQYRRSKFGPIG